MPKTTATDTDQLFINLRDEVDACKTSAEVFKLTRSKAFVEVAVTLPEDDRDRLREHVEATSQHLQHRIKTEQLSGEEITVLSANVLPSRYDRPDGSPGECVVIKGTRANGAPFETIASAFKIVRHFKTYWNKLPAKYILTKNVHPDDSSKQMWNVARIPDEFNNEIPW